MGAATMDPPAAETDGGEGATDHTANGNGGPPAPPVEELRVDGTAQLGMFDAGGKKPGSASVSLSGGKIGLVDGRAYKKGDVIHFHGTAVVTAVKQQDKRDEKTGIVVSCEQQHTAKITDLTVGGES